MSAAKRSIFSLNTLLNDLIMFRLHRKLPKNKKVWRIERRGEWGRDVWPGAELLRGFLHVAGQKKIKKVFLVLCHNNINNSLELKL